MRESLWPCWGGTTYTFVTDGIEAALELSRAAAGDKNVGVWGGANILRTPGATHFRFEVVK